MSSLNERGHSDTFEPRLQAKVLNVVNISYRATQSVNQVETKGLELAREDCCCLVLTVACDRFMLSYIRECLQKLIPNLETIYRHSYPSCS
jgi:hypothetical protein